MKSGPSSQKRILFASIISATGMLLALIIHGRWHLGALALIVGSLLGLVLRIIGSKDEQKMTSADIARMKKIPVIGIALRIGWSWTGYEKHVLRNEQESAETETS